MIREMGSNVID